MAPSEQLSGLIETNAAIQSGDSGGPLVNTAGQVIALDTAASNGYSFDSAASQGFAVPINTALAIVGQIENHQPSSAVHIGPTAFLGVKLQPADQGGLGGGSGASSSGALVASVVSGTPAAQAGLAAGDTIVSVDGQTVDSAAALTTLLDPSPARRRGHDRLDRPVGRAARKHRDARLGTGPLRTAAHKRAWLQAPAPQMWRGPPVCGADCRPMTSP